MSSSPDNCTTNKKTQQNINNMTPNQTKSFANITSQPTTDKFPTQEQAIVLDSITGTKIKDYITGIGNLIGPINILFASRISNNRVCIYLKTKELVENIIKNQSTIIIEHQEVKVRRLINPAKRIILSNVCPVIPHGTLEEHIKAKEIKLLSSITFLKAGMHEPEYAHILSFRRQMYISPEDADKVPESILVTHGNTDYRIFLMEDKIVCYLCKKEGHTSSQCDNAATEESTTMKITTSKRTIPPTTEPNMENFPSLPPNLTQVTKRPAPLSTGSDTENSPTLTTSSPQGQQEEISKDKGKNSMKPTAKKQRSISPGENLTTEELLNPIKDEISNNQTDYILSYDDFKEFIENTYGNPDPLNIAKDFTENVPELISMMQKLYSKLNHRAMKSRFSRITNKLKAKIREEETYSSQESLTQQ